MADESGVYGQTLYNRKNQLLGREAAIAIRRERAVYDFVGDVAQVKRRHAACTFAPWFTTLVALNSIAPTVNMEATMDEFQFTDVPAVAWRPSTFAAGVEVKDLGSANSSSMQLVRFAPGTAFPIHTHAGPEFIYLLEGIAFQEGQQLSPGWGAVAAADSVDTNFFSPSGCVFLTMYSG